MGNTIEVEPKDLELIVRTLEKKVPDFWFRVGNEEIFGALKRLNKILEENE